MNDDDIAERLRLAARADAKADLRADLADVESRSRHIHARRRAVAGVAAAVLIAGAGGVGFGIGQAIGDDDGEQLAAAGATPEVPSATTAPEPTAPPTTVGAPATTAVARDLLVSDEEGEAGGWSPAYGPEYSLLVDRTTDAGIRVRASRGEHYDQDSGFVVEDGGVMDDGSAWRPAAWCNPTADVRVGVAAPGVIEIGGAPWYDELRPGADVMVSAAPVGWADEQQVLVLVVQAAPHVVEVAATVDDVTDRTPVVDGVGVLALATARAMDGFPVEGMSVDVTTADAVTRTLDAEELSPYGSREWQEACAPPPPALPPPGEQPSDAKAAEAEIRQRFALLRDRSIPREEKPDLLDDRTGVDAAIDAVDTGQYAEVVASAVTTIDELVFTSPEEAWFRYTIDTSNGVFGPRYGTVHLIDGSWRFARAVVCQDLALAGAMCDPPVEPIMPPSAQTEERCVETPDGTTCESGGPPTTVAVED